MLIFPAIDLRGGRVVRLRLGDFAQETVYSDDPVEVASLFVDQGAEWLHVVDLDGAKDGEPRQLDIVQKICSSINIPVQMGGGVRTLQFLQQTLDSGVNRAIVGSALVKDPAFAETAFREFGEHVVAGIDARDGLVAISGWLEGSEIVAADLARRLEESGCRRIVFTDIGRDGTLEGPNVPALQTMMEAVDIPVIASGGVSSNEDIQVLSSLKPAPEGVIVGKAIYEGRVQIRPAQDS